MSVVVTNSPHLAHTGLGEWVLKLNVASSSESGQVAAKKLSINYFGSAAASSNPDWSEL